MPIIPWRPFSDMEKFFGDEDWFLPAIPSNWGRMRPAMDVYETDKEVIAEVNLPGINPENVDVSVENGLLKVKGGMEEKKEEKDKGYWRREIRKGSFERIVRLPSAVKEDAIDATYEKGILKITMPKTETKPVTKPKIKIRETKEKK